MSMKSTTRGRLKSVALLSGGVLAGAVLVGATAANAATSTPSPSASSSTSTTTPSQGQPPMGGHGPGGGFGHGGSTPVRSDEKSVSSDIASKLTAEALKQVPGATVYRVETDAGDAAYEVHLTKSDGTLATVKFDKSLAFVRVEAGMGQGDPAPQGAPQGAPTGGTA